MKLNCVEPLRESYPAASGWVRVLPALETHSRCFIEQSSIIMFATVNQQGEARSRCRHCTEISGDVRGYALY
ncbi:hypothetical protein [Gynuella sp.]|uniref:hypothetical protein n=1 Tax=Gynuella sp. TaxID=2969146 RepID=UPI003D11CA32